MYISRAWNGGKGQAKRSRGFRLNTAVVKCGDFFWQTAFDAFFFRLADSLEYQADSPQVKVQPHTPL